MQFFQRYKLVILAAAGAVVMAIFVFWYVPLQRSKARLIQAKMARQSALRQRQTQMQQLPKFGEQIERLRAEVGDFHSKIPAGRPAYGGFLEQITWLMNKHNLQEQSVQPQQQIEAEQVNCIPVNVQCKGSLGEIFEFFKSLQSQSGLKRQIRIAHVELANEQQLNPDKSQVSMRACIGIYYTPRRPGQIQS